MANMIVKTDFPKVQKQILVDDGTAITLGVVVGNTGVTAVDGKKIIKAGTPLSGNLKARNTAFAKLAGEATPVAILLHDVDVTAGNANATVAVLGCVDMNKLESDVQTLITSAVEASLNKIVFIK